MDRLDFYKGRICLNVLGNSIKNAEEIVEAAEGHVVVGVLSANYPDTPTAIEDMKKYQEATSDRLSVGLGAGNPNQCYMVSEISSVIKPAHINQVFSAVGMTRAALDGSSSWINSLVSPTGIPGMVNISTGPLSSKEDKAIIPVKTAIAMIKEMGGNSIKYFPMGGLKTSDEFRVIARECAGAGFALEPTGGIDMDNFREILKIAIEEGVEKIIPHVYSSIIDKTSGDTKVEDVRKLLSIIKELID